MSQDPVSARFAKLLEPLADNLAARSISPHLITFVGFCMTVIALACVGLQIFWLALPFILLNRVCDGLDGMVARLQNRATAFGAFLDTFADIFLYSGVIFMLVLGGRQEYALPALFLLFTWLVSATCARAFTDAAVAQQLPEEIITRKSLFILDGIASQTETTLVLVLICLLPVYFPVIAIFYGIACLLTSGARVVMAHKYLR